MIVELKSISFVNIFVLFVRPDFDIAEAVTETQGKKAVFGYLARSSVLVKVVSNAVEVSLIENII
tara:strand:+ start:721 stop:915 length:195 start_codon:yes stop_codon:yes gene_type:complete